MCSAFVWLVSFRRHFVFSPQAASYMSFFSHTIEAAVFRSEWARMGDLQHFHAIQISGFAYGGANSSQWVESSCKPERSNVSVTGKQLCSPYLNGIFGILILVPSGHKGRLNANNFRCYCTSHCQCVVFSVIVILWIVCYISANQSRN